MIAVVESPCPPWSANFTRPERNSTPMYSAVRITDGMLCVMMKKVAPVSSWIFDDQLVEVGDAHRVEARVGLVEEHDLRVQHQGPGQAGPLLHPARHLARELLQVVEQPDHACLLEDDLADLALGLLRVLAQRERDVVVEVHRAEQRAVLEQHAELAPDPVQVLLAHADDVLAVDPDLARVGPQQPDDVLQQHRLAGARTGP